MACTWAKLCCCCPSHPIWGSWYEMVQFSISDRRTQNAKSACANTVYSGEDDSFPTFLHEKKCVTSFHLFTGQSLTLHRVTTPAIKLSSAAHLQIYWARTAGQVLCHNAFWRVFQCVQINRKALLDDNRFIPPEVRFHISHSHQCPLAVYIVYGAQFSRKNVIYICAV
jgi:hypothetical protein